MRAGGAATAFRGVRTSYPTAGATIGSSFFDSPRLFVSYVCTLAQTPSCSPNHRLLRPRIHHRLVCQPGSISLSAKQLRDVHSKDRHFPPLRIIADGQPDACIPARFEACFERSEYCASAWESSVRFLVDANTRTGAHEDTCRVPGWLNNVYSFWFHLAIATLNGLLHMSTHKLQRGVLAMLVS